MFNTKVRLLLIVFMLFSSIFAYPTPAWGCLCAIAESPEEDFMRANAVFVGTVTDDGSMSPMYVKFLKFNQQFIPPLLAITKIGPNERAVSFEVEESWRGVERTHITVRTILSRCRPPLIQGEKYLIYANQLPDGALHAGACSRTMTVASAASDLDYLQTMPKLELTDAPPMFNPLMLCLAIPLLGAIVLGLVIWRRRTRKPIT